MAHRRFALLAAALPLLAGVISASTAQPPAPFVLVLGTAQDGGIPHLGGHAGPDEAARRDPAHRRLVASLLIVDPVTGRRWLIDASPDLAAQLDRVDAVAPPRAVKSGRPQILDGIFLTHAHVGHYLGLAQLGREVYSADHLPAYGSARMTAFLSANGPWDQLVRLGQIVPTTIAPGERVELTQGLSVTPFLVPHRDEYSDTFGFEIRGPNRSLLYIPDIDKWERWDESIEERLATVDVALLDATFYDAGELPGRSMAEVPHPLVVESLQRFAQLPEGERRKVIFTHLNHSNLAALPGTPERNAIEAAGLRVAEEMERIDL